MDGGKSQSQPVQGKRARSKYFLMQNCCVPKRIFSLNQEISRDRDDVRRQFILNSCFRGLLMVKSTPISVECVVAMAKYWRPSRECFVFSNGEEWFFNDADVARVYGLPYGEGKMHIHVGIGCRVEGFVRELCKRYNLVAKDGQIRESTLRNLLEEMTVQDEQGALDFWRMYVLFSLFSLLVPNTNRGVSVKFLNYLESPETAERYNWALLVRTKLMSALNGLHERAGEYGRPVGDTHCLMVKSFLLFKYTHININVLFLN